MGRRILMNHKVIKSNGTQEEIKFDKITKRIKNQSKGLNSKFVIPTEVTRRVAESIIDGITTEEIDNLISHESARLVTIHPDYSVLAARILVSRWQKNIPLSFSENAGILYDNIDPDTGNHAPLISEELHELLSNESIARIVDRSIFHEQDYEIDYFGLLTLKRGYLKHINNQVAETPQFMWMRVALGIHGDDIRSAIKTYYSMSKGLYTHATPTLFNAGTNRPQMSSCFLQAMKEDSIQGIFSTFSDMAEISKNAGGIGVHIHNVRAKGTYIAGTSGISNGIVPMLRVMNEEARYVDQGGGKRKGSFAVYLEPWHADVQDFLELKKNHGKEEMRARDLFYALWIPDLFMQRVKNNENWSLMCPQKCPGLSDVWGDEFVSLYEKYEKENKFNKQLPARELWVQIIKAQIETGTPYILYKDAANKKSNQKNIGTIKSSNLCTEIMEVSTPDETAVCNLASIALPKFFTGKKINYTKLVEIAHEIAVNLNKVIDRNFYPTKQAEKSNFRHRPIGIGIQGLADLFAMLKIDFESEKAKQINKKIFAAIYYGALQGSIEWAKNNGTYETFEGSPASKGQLQFDLWEVEPHKDFDWNSLKSDIQKYGLGNSLLIAPMPTASTSQILGNNECFEPFTSNLYVRRVLSGEFVMVNKHLVNDLIELNLWNEDVKNEIIRFNGSIQNIVEIPVEIKNRYKTVWEVSMKSIIDQAADRGPYVCQSQSMNLFLAEPTVGKVNSMHFYAWEKGLKTGMYYLRSKPAAQAKKITLENSPSNITVNFKNNNELEQEAVACSLENPEICDMCSG
jgi:ribonucleoside-diphosphate reductase alpha chain